MKTKNKITIFDYNNKEVLVSKWEKEDFNLNEPEMPIHTALAYKLNNDLNEGFYIEIGAGHYKNQNNTYFLEKNYGWKGISIDNSNILVDEFNKNRINKCIYGDALTFNFEKYLEENNFPKQIDFLSIDIDFQSHKYANLLALLNLPITKYKFKIISIEHSAGVFYELEDLKNLQRKILTMLGYSLLIRGKTDDIWSLESINSINGFVQIANMDWNNL